MNISLYFESSDDVFNFIQVNKKALQAIEGLKVNPFFGMTQKHGVHNFLDNEEEDEDKDNIFGVVRQALRNRSHEYDDSDSMSSEEPENYDEPKESKSEKYLNNLSWFFRHFSPETINCNYERIPIELINKAKYVTNFNFIHKVVLRRSQIKTVWRR